MSVKNRKKKWLIALAVIGGLCIGALLYWWIAVYDPVGDRAREFADRLADAGDCKEKQDAVIAEIDVYYKTLDTSDQEYFNKSMEEAIHAMGGGYTTGTANAAVEEKAKAFAQQKFEALAVVDMELISKIGQEIEAYRSTLSEKDQKDFDEALEKAGAELMAE